MRIVSVDARREDDIHRAPKHGDQAMRILARAIAAIAISITGITWARGGAAPSITACPLESCASLGHADIQATWPARCPLCRTGLRPVQSPALVRVALGPMIDMDNRRRDEDEARERKRKEQLREQYGYYGYAHPPGGYNYAYPPGGYTYTYPPRAYSYAYPPGGYPYTYPPYVYTYPAPRNGYNQYPRGGPYPYSPPAGYYRDPATGQYYYVHPQSVDPDREGSGRPNE
jgi:hypothetical protein